MLLLILLVLTANAVISFAYTAMTTTEPSTVWGMYSTNYTFFLGLTQTGIIFSAIMRIAKSEWGKYFSRFGEILTLSYIPFAFITFIVVYLGGTKHLFYWASPEAAGHGAHAHPLSPWLNKDLFFWRTILSMTLFYVLSYVYFVTARTEERGGHLLVGYDIEKRLNVLASFVMVTYVITNTNTAWDFGMMIIKHWESTIFPPYYWVTNVFAGAAFLFIAAKHFIGEKTGKALDREHLGSVGVLFMGYTLLWVYMFWSQHIVIWYGDMPTLTGPIIERMSGNYLFAFIVMLLFLFIIPFFAMLYRVLKHCQAALTVTAALICAGVWVNRYLMIMPVFSDGSKWPFISWTGISLILGGLAITVLPVVVFMKLFPNVAITTAALSDKEGHGH